MTTCKNIKITNQQQYENNKRIKKRRLENFLASGYENEITILVLLVGKRAINQ